MIRQEGNIVYNKGSRLASRYNEEGSNPETGASGILQIPEDPEKNPSPKRLRMQVRAGRNSSEVVIRITLPAS